MPPSLGGSWRLGHCRHSGPGSASPRAEIKRAFREITSLTQTRFYSVPLLLSGAPANDRSVNRVTTGKVSELLPCAICQHNRDVCGRWLGLAPAAPFPHSSPRSPGSHVRLGVCNASTTQISSWGKSLSPSSSGADLSCRGAGHRPWLAGLAQPGSAARTRCGQSGRGPPRAPRVRPGSAPFGFYRPLAHPCPKHTCI